MVETATRPTDIVAADAVDAEDTETTDSMEDRGTLDVRHKALQRIVEHVASTVPGTVAHRSALGRVTGTALPKADITAEGRAVRVKLEVAVTWPGDVTRVAMAAREAVRQEAFRLSGIQIRSVDVTVHAVDPSTSEDTGRRVE